MTRTGAFGREAGIATSPVDVLRLGAVREGHGAASVAGVDTTRAYRVFLCGLLLATVLSPFAGAVRAMPSALCHVGDACHAPEPVCMQAAPALPARLAPAPNTPPAASQCAAVEPPPTPRLAATQVTLPAARTATDLYLLTSRLRR